MIENEALKELAAARDEARLQLVLLTMDARDRWHELEERFDSLEQDIEQSGEKTSEACLAATRHLAQFVKDFFKGREQAETELCKPIRTIMSKPVRSCFLVDSLNVAAQILRETKCEAVPVITVDRTLVGMITDRDICSAAYTQRRLLSELQVESVMTNVAHPCVQDDPIARVLEIMLKDRVRPVPIIHKDGHLVGSVSLADVASWIRSQHLGRASAWDSHMRALAAISIAPAEQALR